MEYKIIERYSKGEAKSVVITDDLGNELVYNEGVIYNSNTDKFLGDGTLHKARARIGNVTFRRRITKSKNHDYTDFVKDGKGRASADTLNSLQQLVDFAVLEFKANQKDRGDFEPFYSIEKTIG